MGSTKINQNFVFLIIAAIICCSNEALAKSRQPISDSEIREKKQQCYADIESGLWGSQCKSSMIAKENCALQCLSPTCYELIYESDPLEEGEKDIGRSSEYKYCMYNWKALDVVKILLGVSKPLLLMIVQVRKSATS